MNIIAKGPGGRIGGTDGEYSVAQFFKDGTYEYVRRWVSAQEAAEAAHHYTRSIAAQIGLVVKVVITDGGDFTSFEWQKGKGITFPTRADGLSAEAEQGAPK